MRAMMSRAVLFCILAPACLGSAVQAQTPLQSRISLSYQAAEPRIVFQALAVALGYRLRFDSRVTGTVTVDVRGITAETALKAICESIGCRWRVQDGGLYVERDPTRGPETAGEVQGHVRGIHDPVPGRIFWDGAPADAVFKSLARMLDADVSVPASFGNKRVTLSVTNGTMRTAMDAICHRIGCRWSFVETPTRILRLTASPFAPNVARVGDPGVVPPKAIRLGHPLYTHKGREAKRQGSVLVECVVEPDGSVGDVVVTRSLDPEFGLDEAAVKAAKESLFKPGMRAGQPIPVVVELEFTFTLR